MAHTQEPWRVGKSGAVVADYKVPEMGGSDDVDYYGGHLVGESIIPSNARRIVACVNACAHVSTEFLENTPDLATAFMSAENARLMQVNAELLAAAKNLIDVKGRYNTEIAMKRLIETIAKAEAI